MRPDDAVHANIQHLLGDPLTVLAAVWRYAHERRHRGRDAGRRGYLAPVQHVLQAVTQRLDVVWIVFHLEHDTIIWGAADGQGCTNLARRERHESGLARFQRLDHAVQTRDVHSGLLTRTGLPVDSPPARDPAPPRSA